MSRREYTQTVKPVSRVPEKIFGWLAWLPLFVLTVFGLYQLLVNGNNPDFIAQMKNALNTELGKNPDFQNALNEANMSVDELVPLVVKSAWGVLAYTILPLLFGLIGLLKMKKRIFAGIMLLIAGLLVTPLFFTFIFGFIPLFFFIAAILLFARKDKVITNADYYDNSPDVETVNRTRNTAPDYVERDEHIERERSNDYVYDADREANYKNRTVEEVHEAPVKPINNVDHDYNQANSRDFDNNHDGDRDRVTYVDNTKDAVDERRDNYNKRNQ
ncbi:DUF4064 domain-containing protein [Macrococcoides caseolyticum]|uniref:DUF4064 domain-containing protein n=1 Tax=Macrococcoides caseolyticum TaxID=69966 RepID=UPI001F1E4909|nr:DUF4064 domain-containing protein [Macrococcus caseolyticus]MCE4956910.1 DUF4064 domain-containing protein [Macrococcus caseolyticus]